MAEADTSTCSWTEVCFIQLLAVSAVIVESVIKVAPKRFLLASVAAKRRNRKLPAEGPSLDDIEPTPRAAAPHPAKGEMIDIKVWLLAAKEVDGPKAQVKAPHERPNGGIVA